MSTAIEFVGVTKSFSWDPDRVTTLKSFLAEGLFRKTAPDTEWTVLDQVSFSVKKGEFVGFMGRNGVGKSTILKLICGLYRADNGLIRVDGQVAPLIELGAGFVNDLSGLDNIFLNAAILGYSRSQAASLIDRIVEFSELGQHISKPVKSYSSGMVIRLGFSVAAHIEAPILLFDEVLAVGDIAFQKKCLNRIKELHEQGRTIMLVTHDPVAAQNFCSRCIVLENSKVAFDGSASEGAAFYEALF